jgi:His-Xaa-Ser system protein HxsD
MKMVIIPIDESKIQIEIDSSIYSTEVIHKCFYWLTGRCSINFKTDQDSFVITISDPKNEWDIESILTKIKADLIDFKTREIIYNETKYIREMLIAKAFANNDEFDEHFSDNINDSFGFEPSKI